MLRIHIFFVVSRLCFLVFSLLGANVTQAVRYASIITEPATGRVFHQVNADVSIPPASLTKLMTLRLVFQALENGKLRLDQRLPVSLHAQRQAPSKLGLKVGEFITVKEAILALITKSANDAAVILAEALAGNETKFAQLMTATAKTLGMHHTIFYNASGLPHPLQKTTARDMAILGAACKDFPKYYPYFQIQSFQFRGKTHKNHNKLLGKVPGVDGLKTGFTCNSGYNLTVSVVRNHRRLIAVVLGGPTAQWRDQHMTHLINTAYNAPEKLPLLTAGLGLKTKNTPLQKKGAGTAKKSKKTTISSLLAAHSSKPHAHKSLSARATAELALKKKPASKSLKKKKRKSL